MRLIHIDFYLRVFFLASVGLLAFVTIRPHPDGPNNNNFLLFEANINNNNNNNPGRANNNDLGYSAMPQRLKKGAALSVPVSSGSQTGGMASGITEPPPALIAPQNNNETEAMELLDRSMRILCICQTTGPRHKERAIHVKVTWGRRCSKLIFASDEDDNTLPAYRFSEWAGREYVSFKMRGALQWAHDNELESFDWFLKADDDSFIVMENLRGFLSNFNPNHDHYFGRHFSVEKSIIGENFVSGASYALSRSSLKRLVEEAFPNPANCPQPTPEAHEDVNLGYCLSKLGILPGETRDQLGRHRFLVFSPWVHLMTGSADRNNWIRKYDKFEYVEGDGCCSDTAILIHYVPAGYMLAMEYFLYRLRPMGTSSMGEAAFRNFLPSYASGGIESLKNALISRGYKIGPRRKIVRRNAVKMIIKDQTTFPPM